MPVTPAVKIEECGPIVRPAVARTTAPEYVDGDIAPLSVRPSDGAVRVTLVDGITVGDINVAGSQQYADGAARGTATGNLMMGDDGTNIQSVAVDTSGKLKALLDQYTPVSGKLPVDPSGVDSPVLLQDGSGNAITSTTGALDVNIKSGSSAGTEYTEGDTDTTITGTAILWEDTSDTLRSVSASKPLPVSVANSVLHVDDNSGSLTVDGTVAATQSGTWNVTNVSGTVSLPTGAATAAKQPALGTSGTPSSDVLTIQGVSGMTAVKVDGSAATQPVSGTVTANAGSNLNTSALALETGGNLASIKAKTDNIPAQGQALMAASLPVAIASNQSAIPASQSGTWNVGTLATVTNVVHVDDNSSTLSVDDGSGSLTVDNNGTFAVQSDLAKVGGSTLAKGQTTKAGSIPVVIASDQAELGGLSLPVWDYGSCAYGSTTKTWTLKSGGAGGTTVATLTLTYTDSTMTLISTVART